MLGLKFSSYHNLYFLIDLMNQAQEAIANDSYIEFVEEFKKD